MSITAGLTGLFVVLIRAIKKIPRRLTVFLWLVPFLRMTIPIGLNNPYSLMSLLSRFSTRSVVVYKPYENTAFSMTNYLMAADTYFPITYKVNVLNRVFYIASTVWIIVFAVIFALLIVNYSLSKSEIKSASHLRDNIYVSDKILSPAVYGIIKPKIILPASHKERDLELILLHEKTHIRRGDNLWRIIVISVVVVHWFNPLAWIFLKLFLADLELSCDECVLAKLGKARVKEYALTLLEHRQVGSVISSSFGGAKIRARIENILSFKKMTWFSFAVIIVLIAVIFWVLLTNAG